MNRSRIGVLIASLAVAACPVLHSQSAAAAGPSAAVLIGNGFKDGYNLGFGARGGLTLPMNVYVGGTFVYHLGKSEGDANVKVFYLGGEGGYELPAGPLTIRPYLGLGYASVTASTPGVCVASVCVPSLSSSTGKVAFWPGATALFPVAGFFVGADVRYVVVVDADSANAFSAFATGGLSF